MFCNQHSKSNVIMFFKKIKQVFGVLNILDSSKYSSLQFTGSLNYPSGVFFSFGVVGNEPDTIDGLVQFWAVMPVEASWGWHLFRQWGRCSVYPAATATQSRGLQLSLTEQRQCQCSITSHELVKLTSSRSLNFYSLFKF